MIRSISLEEYFWLAAQVTKQSVADVLASSDIGMAESAVHAPDAGFAGKEFYPEILDKASVLLCHLVWNHPLVDGNKWAGWAALIVFLELNGAVWLEGQPDVDEAESAVLDVAAHHVDAAWFAAWLGERAILTPKP